MHACVRACMSACVRACVRACERRACGCVRVRAPSRVWVYECRCMHACVRASESACLCCITNAFGAPGAPSPVTSSDRRTPTRQRQLGATCSHVFIDAVPYNRDCPLFRDPTCDEKTEPLYNAGSHASTSVMVYKLCLKLAEKRAVSRDTASKGVGSRNMLSMGP
ncbi:hypothetical protein EVAR_87021_1 [Eumeta japonica]|uniref:Uncharacterized protein n=1 Tax=Eumeta variegata TaxID=151549 RepID=A0A4C1Z483_EUMVA|nr:hypothetical protein EVAR_87021_1 [Eumeta japonica]